MNETNDKDKPLNHAQESVKADGFYRALISLRIHQDRLLWSRVQLLIAVQGAVIGGSYAIGDHFLAGSILFAGFVLSLVIHELVAKDQIDRDVNLKLIDQLGNLLIPEEIKKGLTQPYIRFSGDPPKYCSFTRGRNLIRFAIWFFILLDAILAILHFYKPELAPILIRTT